MGKHQRCAKEDRQARYTRTGAVLAVLSLARVLASRLAIAAHEITLPTQLQAGCKVLLAAPVGVPKSLVAAAV